MAVDAWRSRLGRHGWFTSAALLAVAALALSACSAGHPAGTGATSPGVPSATATARPSPTANGSSSPTAPVANPPLVQAVRHVFVIMMENESASTVLWNADFRRIASQGDRLTHYYGVAHPSQPNYIAMVAGATLVSDDSPHDLPQTNLADLLRAAGLPWKAYEEGYPGSCFNGVGSGLYARKHNPFISFNDVRNNPAQCANIVNAAQLNSDIASGNLPAFSFYTPNLVNDGHNGSLAQAGAWLAGFLQAKLADPRFSANTLVVITFDEGSGNPATDPLYTVLLGSMVRAGTTDPTPYNHYSILRTVEQIFRLGSLHRADATATAFRACDYEARC